MKEEHLLYIFHWLYLEPLEAMDTVWKIHYILLDTKPLLKTFTAALNSGCAINQTVSRWPITTVVWVQSQTGPRGAYGGRSRIGSGRLFECFGFSVSLTFHECLSPNSFFNYHRRIVANIAGWFKNIFKNRTLVS
jgi:hypothetical protein